MISVKYATTAKMGCMYDGITGNSDTVDMVQFGWMVAHIIFPIDDYHGRKWEIQPPPVKDDKFIKNLGVNWWRV